MSLNRFCCKIGDLTSGVNFAVCFNQKSMRRLFRLSAGLVFLLAIASNCIQTSQIALDPIGSLVTELTATDLTFRTDDSQFLVADDHDSSDSPDVIRTEPQTYDIQSVLLFSLFQRAFITSLHANQHDVLRL